MSANVDAMVREGINAYRAGNKEEARTLLLKAVEIDESNEQAWLWLSGVVDTPEDRQTCLENVLTINPNNERAKQGLQMLKQEISGGSAQKTDEDAFADVSFTQPTPAAPPPPEDDELPSSIEWDMPPTETSSPSSTRRVNELTSADYDDWVAGLNLNTASTPAMPAPPPVDTSAAFTSPFVMDDIDDNAFGFDEDPDIPASTSAAFGAGPFDSRDDLNFDDDDDDDVVPVRREPSRMMSPSNPTPAAADPLLGDMDDDDDLFDDYDQAEMGALDPSEFFAHIPLEIKATRLPGSKEREPVLALLVFIVLLFGNIGAIGLLVTTLIR